MTGMRCRRSPRSIPDMRVPLLISLLIVIGLAVLPALGDAEPSSSRPVLLTSTVDASSSRAWSVYRNSQGDNLLVFIAPRDADPSSTPPIDAAPPGQVQSMRSLGSRFPAGVGAIAERVYLVYPPVYANDRRIMRVYSADATPGAVGGLWLVDPLNRLNAHDPIETRGTLSDLEASADALWALLEEDNGPRLLRFDGTAWAQIELPESIDRRRLDLVTIADRVVLVDRVGVAFSASLYNAAEKTWEPFESTLSLGLHTQLLSGRRAITALDWDEDGKARARAWSAAGVFTIAEGMDLSPDARYSVLDSSQTLVGMLMLDDEPAADNVPRASVEIVEYDLVDGVQRYRGPPSASSPVSPEEFRFLIGMMMLIMSGVLIVVIMPDRSDAMQIPDACVLADPGRRLIATMLDAVLVASVVGWFFDVSASEILTMAVIVRPDNAWAVIPITMIVGVAASTMSEWLLGRTLGKVLVGIRVVRAQPGALVRPRLWSALVRNAIKWILPPVAALALIDPEALHRGDRASRTLVVSPRPADPISSDRSDPDA
jgi:uncharacterized RDD family membrane protein YckC